MEPRIRVSSILRWQGRVLLCRQEKPGKEYWLLPGGGVDSGETLIEALRRELDPLARREIHPRVAVIRASRDDGAVTHLLDLEPDRHALSRCERDSATRNGA